MTSGHRSTTTRRGPLAAFMLASFAVGMVLMLAFDAPLTRVAGMTALVGFMVSGLFLVADPEMLEPDGDGPNHADRPEPGQTATE